VEEGRPHLLLVDDSPLVTGALRVLFEETGYDVSVAGTIREAVAAAGTRRVDVMLLDLTLPDGDGLAALTAMRERGTEPRVRAAMTGRDEAEVTARCVAAGCHAVLVKPVPIGELMARVREWTAPGRRAQ
jgi:two-component system KDP operon response regulator KdpE